MRVRSWRVVSPMNENGLLNWARQRVLPSKCVQVKMNAEENRRRADWPGYFKADACGLAVAWGGRKLMGQLRNYVRYCSASDHLNILLGKP